MPTAGTPQNTAAKTAPKQPFNPMPLVYIGLFLFVVFMITYGIRLMGILHPDPAKCTNFVYNLVQHLDMNAWTFKWHEKIPLVGGQPGNWFNEPGVGGKWLGACKTAPVPFSDGVGTSLFGYALNLGLWIVTCARGRGGFNKKRWLGLVGLLVVVSIFTPSFVTDKLGTHADLIRTFIFGVIAIGYTLLALTKLETKPIIVTSSKS